VNIAIDWAALSAIDEKLSTLARPSGGLSEAACAANMLADKTTIEAKSGTRKLSCMLGAFLTGFLASGIANPAYDACINKG
jgi:hypothetical protein